MGYESYITESGDSLGSYTVYQTNGSADDYQPSGDNYESLAIHPVGQFVTTQTNITGLPVCWYKLFVADTIVWIAMSESLFNSCFHHLFGCAFYVEPCFPERAKTAWFSQ